MSSLDFKLRHLQQSLPGEMRIHVLLQYRNDLRKLESLGFRVTSVAGDVAAGTISVDQLDQLAQHPEIIFVGGSRLLKDEMDVSSVYVHLRDPIANLRTIPTFGRGSIIGVIDSAFDLTHPCFRNAKGQTRILAAWDQKDGKPGRAPAGFDYGVEFDREAINRSLADKQVVILKNNDRAGSHGTNVAGIAAGNGTPGEVFEGVAPEAEMILVSYRNENDVPIGGSAFVLDAINFIREHASARGRPVVINISQGDNLGAHDGTSLLERAIDNVIKEGRVLIVNSAGNERAGLASHHAHGEVEPGGTVVLPFALDGTRPVDGDTIDLWYRRCDRFSVALRTPDGYQTESVEPGTSVLITFPTGNRAQVYSETDYPTNGDNRIGVIFEKGPGWVAGTWELILRGKEVRLGDFDAWADRSNGTTLIGFQGFQTDAASVTLPGNARRVITVGGFVSRPEEGGDEVPGALARGSSIGPTRDGRVKPDLTAPSTLIMAPRMRVDSSPPTYGFISGTSMAAPQVTGVIALIWSLWPQLKAGQIRAALCSTARADMFTGVVPSTSWGSGKIDAEGAYKALLNLVEMGESVMENQVAFEFEMKPQENSEGKPAGMLVRIEVKDGNTLAITGKSGADAYEGLLVFKKISKEAKRSEFAELLDNPPAPGGDECYVNGRWVNPCPM